MSRMRLIHGPRWVVLCYHDPREDRSVVRDFECRGGPGFVWEKLNSGGRVQVCKGLALTGSTLMISDPKDLPAIIRAEYRRMRRWGAKEKART